MNTVRITIHGTGSELQGVGRLPDGRAVFVPGALPGEIVDAAITREKERYCEASLIEVIEPSPERVGPTCPHAGTCGGCQGRHMRYKHTLQLKRQAVYDALTRIGGQEQPRVLETLGCAEPERTRNKAEYPIAFQNGHMVIGAHGRADNAIIPLTDCLSQSRESAEALAWVARHLGSLPQARHLKTLVTRTSQKGELMLIFCGDAPIASEIAVLSPTLARELPALRSLWYCQLNRRATHALDGKCTRIWGSDTLIERLFDLTFEVSPQSFFQVNTRQTEKLYAAALDAAGVAPDCGLRILDAYCGAGTITLSAARHAKHVTGIEIVPPAIENAKQNARRNHLDGKTRFICADAAREIPRLLSKGTCFDAAILDPPRKGAEPTLLQALAQTHIPTIAYVSCHPGTLARDVKMLSGMGYALKLAQPVDMFPWTGHVETVVLLTRNT